MQHLRRRAFEERAVKHTCLPRPCEWLCTLVTERLKQIYCITACRAAKPKSIHPCPEFQTPCSQMQVNVLKSRQPSRRYTCTRGFDIHLHLDPFFRALDPRSCLEQFPHTFEATSHASSPRTSKQPLTHTQKNQSTYRPLHAPPKNSVDNTHKKLSSTGTHTCTPWQQTMPSTCVLQTHPTLEWLRHARVHVPSWL